MTLTEQWKKGELERGRYYIKYRGNYMSDNWHGDCWEDSWSDYVEEVLAPVPSYVEWKNVTTCFDYEHKAYLSMVEENQQLKELLYSLKCCLTSENIEPQIRIDKSLGKIDEVLK